MKNAFTSKAIVRLCFSALAVLLWQVAGAQTFNGTTGPVPSSGTSGTATFTANAGSLASGTIGSDYVLDNVTISSMTHTFDGDLEISLISPSGTSWMLSENNGGAGDNYTNTVFQDGAPSISTGTPPFTGTFEAEDGPMNSGFLGDQASGVWTLSIVDEFGGDSGFMNSWSITFVSQSCDLTCPASITVSNDPGECGAFVSIPQPTITGGSCQAVGSDYQDVGSNTVPLNFNFTGVVDTDNTINGLPTSTGADVFVDLNIVADIGGAGFEQTNFLADGIFLGLTPTSAGDCNPAGGDATYTISATDYNTIAADGSITFTVTTDSDIDNICVTSEYTVTVSHPASSVQFTNDYNGTDDATDFYPVGTTTVCFEAGTTSGAPVQCCFDVTVNDDEDPVFDPCPNDIVINLDPGLCDAIVSYEVAFTDNCPVGSASVSDIDTNTMLVNGFSLSCSFGAQLPPVINHYFDVLPSGSPGDLDVTAVRFMTSSPIGQTPQGVTSTVQARLYTLTNTAQPYDVSAGNRTLIGTGTPVTVPAGTTINTRFNIPITATIPGGQPVLVELESSHAFVVATPDMQPGGNWWLASTPCGFVPTNPQTAASIGFPDTELWVSLITVADSEPEQTAGLPSGSTFEIGTTEICYTAEDAVGNTAECCFDIIINEFANPTSTLACNDNVQVSLDEDGCSTVGADMILEGGPYGCYDDYIVNIEGGDDVVCCDDIGGPWTAMVTDPDTGNKCWGSIVVEDKLVPIVECEDYTIACTQDIDDLLGTSFSTTDVLDSGSRPTYDASTDNVEFDVAAPLNATVTDVNVSLDISHTWVSDLDVFLIAPDGTQLTLFNDQCGTADNVDVTMDDDGTPFACGGNPAIAGTLQPTGGQLADFNGLAAAGTWTVRVTDDAGGDATNINNIQLQISYAGSYDPPVATDNCSVETFTFTDVFLEGDCAGESGTIIRTWTATDPSGNSTTCTSTITIARPSLDDVELPPSLDDLEAPALDCSGNGWDLNGDGYPQPNESGEPTIEGLTFGNGDLCGFTVYYEDIVIDICPSSFKVRREWIITDWCAGEEAVYVQYVKVIDSTGPSIDCPEGPVTINVYQGDQPGGPHDICTGTVIVPPITVLGDDCAGVDPSGYVTQLWTLGAGEMLEEVSGNGGVFFGVELEADNPPLNNAQYTVRHVIVDACGNITDCIYDITVVDKVPPVAICDEITEVSITNNGGSGEGCSVMPAEVLDDGSYDNCGDVYFFAAEMNPFLPPPYFYQYYPSLEWCCDDIGEHMVILLVLDFDPSQFLLPDGSLFLLPGQAAFEGSFNTCMVTVEVTDKIPPITTFCPANETITCEEYVDDLAAALDAEDYSVLDQFGTATFYDNCATNIDYNVSVNIDNCQEGTIVRSWTASDDNPQNSTASCTQTIFVEHVSDWVVEFPADITAECTDGQLPDFGEPEIYFDECELIGVSHEDQYFYIVADACYKIVRTWTAINWCIYEDFGFDAYSEENSFEAAFFADWDGDGDQDDRTFRDGWNTTGSPGTPDGYIVYQQTIKVNDNEAPEFVIPEIDGCIVDTDCDTDITIPYPDIMDQCSPSFVVNITIEDVDGNVVAEFDDYQADAEVTLEDKEPGEYTLFYEVTDDCGNTSYDTYDLVVEDCKLPTPYCLNGIVVEIMQTQMIEVWASDLNLGSFDNCPGDLTFSFSPDVNDIGVTYTCSDLGQQPVEIWVTDAAGNQDFCETFIVVQDNMGFCSSAPVVAGIVATEEDETIEDVTVDVNGGLFSQVTGADGYYEFQLVGGNDYTITPMNDLDASNGVTTYDLVLISMHILNVQPLNSPYKMIAADANNSESITTLDMVEIRKLILQIEDNFSNNTSWRFVDADYNFPVPTNPWFEAFPEVLNYNDIAVSDLEGDFVGVKIGDVNASAAANGFAQTGNRNTVGDLVLHTDAQTLRAGELYTVSFTAEEAEVLGYQFTLNFDANALELVDLTEGVMAEDNFGLTLLSEGAITASWNTAEARVLSGELFSLTFKATADAELADLLSIGSRYTAAEGYNGNGELLDVQLTIDGQSATAGFELYQNVPNPFKGNTVIGFNLPEATSATLTITDVSGKVLRVVQSDYAKGYNEVNVDNLAATGVLYYKLETATDAATRKMIIVQ